MQATSYSLYCFNRTFENSFELVEVGLVEIEVEVEAFIIVVSERKYRTFGHLSYELLF